MDNLLPSLAESVSGWLRWRARQRSTILGWLMIFAGQAMVGALLFGGFLYLMGAPANMATIYPWIFFSIGCGLSGVMLAFLWAFVFIQIIGIGFGLSVGVWFNLPSWWRAASAEWDAGANIPHLVVIVGLIIPPIWSISCVVVHKGWIKVLDMVISRIRAIFSARPTESDKRKAAAKDLMVTDSEADRALRNTDAEPEGLTVISKSSVVRDKTVEEEEPDLEGEALYSKLTVDGNDKELDGLRESANKSKQKVDASGAVIPDDADKSFDDDLSGAFKAPGTDEKPPVAEEKPKQETKPDVSEALRGEDRSRLSYVADEYNLTMSHCADENKALLDFMDANKSILLGISDREISFLKSLPDGNGLGLAEAALVVQANEATVNTSFKAAVDIGVIGEKEEIARPTAGARDDDEIEPAPEVRQNVDEPTNEKTDDAPQLEDAPQAVAASEAVVEGVVVEKSEDPEQAPTDDDTTDDAEPDFVADFSFSGDEASNALSGKRVASLLSEAAFVSSPISRDFVSDAGEEKESASSSDLPIEDTEETVDSDVPASDASTVPSIPAPIDAMARKLDLMKTGMEFEDATAQVAAEISEREEAISKAAAAELERENQAAQSEADENSDEKAVADTDQEDGASDEDDELFGFPVDKQAVEYREKVAEENDTETLSDELSVSEDTPANEADDSADLETTNAAVVDVDHSAHREEQDTTDMSIDVNVSVEQCTAIWRIMTSKKLEPKEKYESLLELEKTEGYIDTVSAYRSKMFAEHLSDQTANDVKNRIISLFRDFKDAGAESFGEDASEAEAKIADFKQFPHKLDSAKLNILKSSVAKMDEFLSGVTSNLGVDRKIRISRIHAGISELEAILAGQNAPLSMPKKKKATPASDENRRSAESIIKSISGESVSVSTSSDDEHDGEHDDEHEEVDMLAVVAGDEKEEASVEEKSPFADKPWLDPSLGNLDEHYDIMDVGDGIDIDTEDGAKLVQERLAIHTRRLQAKKLREAFLQKEEREAASRNAEQRAVLEKAEKVSDLVQREENLKERESDFDRREAELQAQRDAIEEDRRKAASEAEEAREKLAEEQARIGERGKVLDKLSEIFKGDADRKIEAVRFMQENMGAVFTVRDVPERFAQVSATFMDLALARAIQKRVKGSSVGLQDAMTSENSDNLPERVFPNKLNMAFHGATVFRKSAEIIHKLATEMEVEVSVSNSLEEDVDISALVDACENDEERAFLDEILHWMKPSRKEFFEMTKALEENAHDYRLARKVESSSVQDVEVLAQANAAMKKELDETKEQLAEARHALNSRPAANVMAPVPAASDSQDDLGYTDSGTEAFEIVEFFKSKNFHISGGSCTVPLSLGRCAVVGLLDGLNGLPSKKKVIAELSARSPDLNVIILTNASEAEQLAFADLVDPFNAAPLSFQPLVLESAEKLVRQALERIGD